MGTSTEFVGPQMEGLVVLEAVLRQLLGHHEVEREMHHVCRCLEANPAVATSFLSALIEQYRQHPIAKASFNQERKQVTANNPTSPRLNY